MSLGVYLIQIERVKCHQSVYIGWVKNGLVVYRNLLTEILYKEEI